ncbi:MAG: PIN domain nuclease [Deltaproteobacteria bacterium]|nr:PIN domain nuclease [Deltaproteobacteria bacterium]
MAVLIDSSVWISAAKPQNKECVALKRLIRKNELICIARPIQVEVCQGSRTEAEFHKLWESFLGFDFLEITDRHWGLSAWNYFKCKKKGINSSTLNCLIATLAKEYNVPLWTLDRDFEKMQVFIGFEFASDYN